MQVRPTSDTFWPSKLDSWSAYLTGEQGKKPEPYYDPLKFMIEETHKRGMSFHAWLNPYRVTNIMKFELSANSYAKKHPKAIVEYGGKKYYNPAKKEARDHNVEIITELLTKYDIDGIHFDDYFYPYPVHKNKKDIDFPDKADYDKYVKNGGKMSKADWRRDNVNKLIKQLHATVKKIRPGAAFGISPFGIWRNQSNEVPDASPTKGFQAYEKLYADTRKWIKNGWIDYIMPQLYWSYETKAAPYGILLDWWEQETQKYGNGKVKLYIGLALYKHSGKTKGWPDGELEKQIKDIENRTNVQGGVFFSAKYFLENKNREIEISQNFYKKQLSE
ncbi:MAG: family 10 glycosylhydrolase, partial [Elusimicrobiales bacterium]|nr:family 10 glycosylhydrolase [Elusimicrobiales bacterium]